jgi:hypothetical protein
MQNCPAVSSGLFTSFNNFSGEHGDQDNATGFKRLPRFVVSL